MKSYSVKENPIGPAVSEILRYKQTNKQSDRQADIVLLCIIDKKHIGSAVREILRYKHTDTLTDRQTSCYFIIGLNNAQTFTPISSYLVVILILCQMSYPLDPCSFSILTTQNTNCIQMYTVDPRIRTKVNTKKTLKFRVHNRN